MNDLHQALADIQNIRRQVAENTEFRGYGPFTLLLTALTAMLGGLVQWRWVPDPGTHPASYVALWLSIAVLCSALIATQMITRSNRLHSGMADEMIRAAVLQFLPAGAVGAFLPFALLAAHPAAFFLLPGLWQIIFALGVFASGRSLPRPMIAVGIWFVFTGFACILAGSTRALLPFSMSAPFSLGMVLVAGIQHAYANGRSSDDVQES